VIISTQLCGRRGEVTHVIVDGAGRAEVYIYVVVSNCAIPSR